MTNILDQRTIHPFMTDRKNWLFSVKPKEAEESAVAYSITETANANELNSYKYLTFIFTYLPCQDIGKNREILDKFFPWSRQAKTYCK